MTLPPYLEKYAKLLLAKPKKSSANPSRDWLLLLLAFLLLLVASMAWNIWFFGNVLSGKETRAPESEGGFQSADVIEKAQAEFGARGEERERYRTQYRFVDPSR